ncbi:ABC transporter [Guyanagaster necrorhizus]|uniref:ABC transporter n=1 Tax=Guyanagaster necrorhizus TaxID=856835 RepID=A0A9P7VP88_9AGAR|nr:ABC transporter [Guyanagaster necrorhizus MCA 3950]KAG7444868.1 ABC transporter [Guyanagaster necrorhizus MCA 3950]
MSEKASVDSETKSEKTFTEQNGHPRRARWQRIPFLSVSAHPPKASIQEAELLPEVQANWFDILTFGWITALLTLGYARPLEAPDLYKLQDSRGAAFIGDRITASFEKRCSAAEAYNRRLLNGEIKPGMKALWWTLRGNRTERERKWRETDGQRKPSLVLAINDSIKWWFWSAGILKVLGDTAQFTSPLLLKAIINFAKDSYTAHQTGDYASIPPIGKGIGLTFGLLGLLIVSSLCTHHFFYRSTSTGVLIRGGLISAIYVRSLRLSSRARSKLPNGLIMNHISTDVSRIDFCAGFFHMAWTAPIQLAICLVLLLLNLGPSALVGFAFFVVAAPIQTKVMKNMFAFRESGMRWTDKRAKLLQELLGGMKVVKFFAWEIPLAKRIKEFRQKEMSFVRSILLVKAANIAVALSMPALSSVVAFLTYSATGHQLEVSVVFPSLTLFQLLRLPLMFFPASLSAIADAENAIQRLYGIFEAETLEETFDREDDLHVAVEVKNISFTWDAPPPESAEGKKGKKDKKKGKPEVDPSSAGAVFELKDVSLSIARGQLVAIVGTVGAGKTSLLQGMVGEMRRVPNINGDKGTIKFGGSVGYCPQSAWIQNATIRDNICFGRPFKEDKYWQAVQNSCLERDLDMLPNGDMTEVGEKGISLSGGQKQRLNICRAIYCDTEIQIFDDPLSALDAHVGKMVFQNVLRNAAPGKTRILVTHALHFLPQVDYIFTIADGRIAEQGTYDELMQKDGEFSKFYREFGSQEEKEEEEVEEEEEAIESIVKETETEGDLRTKVTPGPGLMQEEERNTGAISLSVYKRFLDAGRGRVVLPILFASIVFVQTAIVMGSYWLVYWQEDKWARPQGFYMGIYAMLGVAQAFAFFVMGSMFALLTYFASQNLHSLAVDRIVHAPMSFFETTPLGRIMNRFSKDIDTIDNILADSMRMFAAPASSVIGAIILIAIILPWFLIAVFVVLIVYLYGAAFYRASARELKRLDAVLRSSLYSHFSESLSGLATIRAYGESERFVKENEERIDVENRAYWLTVTNQRWLGIRIDLLGSLLTFAVAMLTVGTRFSISPAQTGLALAYILNVQQAFGWLVRQSAEVENDMNSVERIVHYATEIEQEAPHVVPDSKVPESWPSVGRVELKDVVLSYRPGLPAVLKGISMTIKAGEKIGIVGRTGAGKSSIMTALYRLVELSSGSICIDGVDISTLGLTQLRKSLSIIPQDALLFSGTLRSNLDPFNTHDDAKLWDALKRSYLVDSPAKAVTDENSDLSTPINKFSLDTVIEDEGVNLSIGQRSLVSLARALVRDSKILILDEATASVDYETDRNIQDTITREFQDRTILCIAHRLRTIISYDRICVLDAGEIAEFDTPSKLYEMTSGIFRAMCDRSSITLDDIRLASNQKVN